MRVGVLVALLVLGTLAPLQPAASSTSSCSSGPANDCRGAAIEWFGKPERYSNAGATMEAGENRVCETGTISKSVWFHVEVVSPGSEDDLAVTLDDVSWYATLALYEDGPSGLVLLDCRESWYDEGLWAPTAFAPCTPGARYWIQVGSLGSDAGGSFDLVEWESFWRDECWFKPTLPTEPRVSAPTPGNREVRLSWVEPWWDGGRSVSISHYKVYRATSCTGAFTHVGSPTSRGFTDTGLAPGTTYCYRVTAVNPVGEGPYEPGRSATTWPLPRPPTDLSVARAGDGELRLTWQPSPDQGGPAAMVEHRIYRSAASTGPFERVGTAGASATSYTDAGLGRGETWHYRVSAVNVVGEGSASGTASGTTWRVPGAPRDVAVRHVVGFEPLEFRVTWRAPADPAPFTHYRVYRANSPGGSATLVAEVSSLTTQYDDGHRLPFLDYYYEVRAYNPAGAGEASARACYVYPIGTPLGRCA